MHSSDHHSATDAASAASETQANSVYRYYDRHKILIYVGITCRGAMRNRQHNDDKAWWPFVAEQVVDHFDTRAQARAREIELIQQFRPPFNKQHNPEYEELRQAYIELQQSGAMSDQDVKALANSGKKKWIKLHALTTGDDAIFVTRLGDGPIVQCLRHRERVPVMRRTGTAVGRILRIDKDHGAAAKIFTKLSLPPRKRIKEAVARVAYVRLKEPVLVEFSRIIIELD
jgi:hypothetical protein